MQRHSAALVIRPTTDIRMPVAPQLLEILVCPKCKGPLEYREAEDALICQHDKLRYPVRDGIPIMLIDEATPA
jgi:hypothetical protein